MAKARSTVRVSPKTPKSRSNNQISNTKYSMLSFPFMMMRMQCESPSSVFFILIIVFQISKTYRITSLYTSVMPWAIIFSITIVREFLDNYSRYVRDKELNTAQYKKLKGERLVNVESQHIRVGDIILLEKGQRVPADCLLLKSEDNAGEIFIRTDQLDGETDWKRRSAPAETQQCSIRSLFSIEAEIEEPSKEIYTFAGRVVMNSFTEKREDNQLLFGKAAASSGKSVKEESFTGVPSIVASSAASASSVSTESLSEYTGSAASTTQDQAPVMKEISCDLDNTVWANTVVSSSSALGMVIYTGHYTRSMMNTNKPRSKTGIIDKEMDVFVLIMACISVLTASIFTLMRAGLAFNYAWSVVCIRFVMIFSYVIPISLKFMVTTARYVYIYLLRKDPALSSVKVLTNTLQEELARISFFLTDKTGTLTKNEMIMRRLHIGTVCYNAENKEEIMRAIDNVLAKAASSKKHFWKKSKSSDSKIFDLIEALSVCHSVMPIESTEGLHYQASSPDEVAMVNYTGEIGVKLVGRDNRRMVVECRENGPVTYEILYSFPFNSDTKRMGIVLKKDGEYIFFEKGADTVMKSIIKETDWIEEETDNMAREGLRTLVIAKKVISEADFAKFEKGYNAAKMSLVDRNEKMLEEQCKLEKNLEVVGLTGVEDKLQDKVKQTLESLRNAGIKIWMLTGDKIETAISIAFSSRLLTKNDHYMIIAKCTSKEEIVTNLNALSTRGYNSLVIDGSSLEIIIQNFLDRFIEISKELHCVVGCRYSPTQKAIMAASLRIKAKETVLCIGDGGNDVSMITQANVGVGLEGKEGSQASLAADFALKNFSDVAELMFFHGRRSYKNTSKIAHLIFHRGVLLSTIQAIFCSLIHFFPMSILQGKMPLLFITFTIIPLFWVIISQDIPKALSMQFPELFKELQINDLLSIRQFFISISVSIYQAAIFILCYFRAAKREMFSLSIICFTNLIINEQLMVLLSTPENIRVRLILICAGCIAFYLCSIPVISEIRRYDALSKTGLFLLAINAVAIAPRLLQTLYNLYISPSSHVKISRQR